MGLCSETLTVIKGARSGMRNSVELACGTGMYMGAKGSVPVGRFFFSFLTVAERPTILELQQCHMMVSVASRYARVHSQIHLLLDSLVH